MENVYLNQTPKLYPKLKICPDFDFSDTELIFLASTDVNLLLKKPKVSLT